MIPVESNILQGLPDEILEHIFGYTENDFLSLRLVDHRSKAILDDLLKHYWNRLKAQPPQGPIELRSLMGRIETQKSPEEDYILLFKRLANACRSLGSTVNKLPFSRIEFEALQNQSKIAHDESLLAIWPKIATVLPAPALNTAEEIRTWLNDPNNSNRLNTITDLNLTNLNLRVLPPEIARLTQLRGLNLSNNDLITLPEAIGSLTQLQRLYLNDNNLITLPEAIGSLTQLQRLNLDSNDLITLPEAIGSLTQLQGLYLNNNDLITLPEAIGSLTQLEWLDLDNNNLITLPEAIGSLTQLQRLDLNNNDFITLPEAIGSLTQLRRLNLDNNDLIILPEAIGSLTQLQWLFLDNNNLITFPEAIGSLTQLRRLSLNDNDLITFPEAIGSLTQLLWLYLNNNDLITLPEAIGSLTQLLRLDLNNNNLITLPEAIGSLTQLQRLDLDGNALMFISNKVLNSTNRIISNHTNILNYKNELNYKSDSNFSKFYQSIMQRKNENSIKEEFHSCLSMEEKNLVFEMVWVCAGSPKNTDLQWGEHHVFEDMHRFYLAVRKAISTKLERLPQVKKYQVHGHVYRLAGSPETDDAQWGEYHALDNFPRLVDAMALLN